MQELTAIQRAKLANYADAMDMIEYKGFVLPVYDNLL